jgi:hypothetical protein
VSSSGATNLIYDYIKDMKGVEPDSKTISNILAGYGNVTIEDSLRHYEVKNSITKLFNIQGKLLDVYESEGKE